VLRRLLIAVAVVAFSASQAAAQTFVFPGQAAAANPNAPTAGAVPEAATETALLADAADGRLDRLPLLDAALIAGGTVEPRTIDAYHRRFDHWIAELQVSGRVVGTERDRARAVFDHLHTRILTGGFRETSTSLVEAFEHGRFNCLSSVILFRALAERFDLKVHGVEVPGHAFAMVDAIGNGDAAESFVVQTTCRDWFAAAGDAELQRNLLRRTIGASAADTAAQAKRERRLTDVGLLAVMYYNRGVDLLEVGNHEAAIAANRTALQLDQANDAARANLLAEALRTLETGLQFAPEYGLFHENLVALHQQRLAGSTSPRDAEPSLTALRGCYARWHRELSRRGLPVEADAVARRAADDPFLRGVN